MTTQLAPTLDLLPICRSLTILNKFGQLVPFEPNWAQKQILQQVKFDYEAGKPSRIVTLKARQLGISTVTEAILFALAVLEPNTQAAVIAHDSKQSEYLFTMVKRFYETGPWKELWGARRSSIRQLTLDGQDSTLWVFTAENPNSVRGRVYSGAHLSEAAFYSDPTALDIALGSALPDIPGNIKIVESTANGIGNWFHDLWEGAVAGKNGYTPFFFPWFKHYEYIPCSGYICEDATCETCLAATKGLKPKDQTERDLMKAGATKAHIAWRRHTLANKFLGNEQWFAQEMPATAEEAFLAAGVNAFPLGVLELVYRPESPAIGRLVVSAGEVKFVPDPQGTVRIFKKPASDKDWASYYIGADPCYGFGGAEGEGDYAAAHVLNRRTKEQVAVWHGRTTPENFADELAMLGKFYNLATIGCENEGGGIATNERLRHIYPRLYQRRTFDSVPGQDRSERQIGWSTNWKTKALAVLKLVDMVQRQKVIIHDEATFKEMRGFTFYGGQSADKFGPGDTAKGRDDLVMALAIACICESQEADLQPYEITTDPTGIIWAKEQKEEDGWP